MTSPAPPALRAEPRDEEVSQVQHRQLLRSILATLSEGVLIADARGTILYSSPYADRLFGGGLATAPAQVSALGLFHSDEQAPFSAEELPIWRALKGEDVRGVDMFVRNQSVPQGKHVLCDGIPLRDEQGLVIGAMSLVRDLDKARLREEEERRKLTAELERRIAERTAQLALANRELENFSYSVAHDLRAPLRAIISYTEAMIEDCADSLDATGHDYVKRIRSRALRMSELINGVQALSRIQSLELEPGRCDLSALARAISEQLQAQFPGRTVRFTLQEGLVDQGDPRLLRSLLEQLLGNAWKFTRERPVAEIEFSARQEQGVRTYFVKDNGAGFEMTYQHKLFGVFQRLHSQVEFEGNGVGLAIAQRIIHRHGGRIWGDGRPGQGACFFFTLNELSLPPATAVAPGASRD